jgi:hypothetical protein
MWFFTLIYLTFPYRVFYQNRFDVATFQGEVCYVTGDRDGQMLLFCPHRTPSRNVRVAKGADGLQYLGRSESLFSLFDATVVRNEPAGR